MKTAHATIISAMLDKELRIHEQELDAAQRYLDETAERHRFAAATVATKRATVAALLDVIQDNEWPTRNAATPTTPPSSPNSEPEATPSQTSRRRGTAYPTSL